MARRRILLVTNPPPVHADAVALAIELQRGLNLALARIDELTNPRTFVLEQAGNVHPTLKAGLVALQIAAHADDTDHRAHADFMLALRVCSWATGCDPGDIIDKWLNRSTAGDELAEWIEASTDALSRYTVEP